MKAFGELGKVAGQEGAGLPAGEQGGVEGSPASPWEPGSELHVRLMFVSCQQAPRWGLWMGGSAALEDPPLPVVPRGALGASRCPSLLPSPED